MREKKEFNFVAATNEKEVTARTIWKGVVMRGFCKRRKEEKKKTYRGSMFFLKHAEKTCVKRYKEF